MKVKFHKVLDYILKLESKIAFYPTLIGLMGLVFAIFMYYIENLEISKYLLEHAPWLVINNVETARTILTTFVGGLISIMVFSFSMVMILLSQASSNYSPRVLPGLISNRRHQIVLGIYNSCLLYCIFTLISIEPTGDKYQLPGFSVLLAIIFMTLCLGAFIYFIHSISQEIQINNIMLRIFSKAKNRLSLVLDYEKDKQTQFPNTDNWYIIESQFTGYLSDIANKSLLDDLLEKDVKAKILVYKGQYIREGTPILSTNKKLNKKCKNELLEAFHFSRSELIDNNYMLAYKQITEISVKAMSPGINDPGTTINAIDYLTELFALRMQKKDTSFYYKENGEPIIHFKTVSFKNLLYNTMGSLRTYCRHDIIIVQKLMLMLIYLYNYKSSIDKLYYKAVKSEIINLHDDALKVLENKKDKETIERLFKSL